ncbi:MAG: hypothetical protein KGS72_17880 [Cyanobacteria bacterium REEB67]|nr:hypothetical protein [Cyanobacteria bacterium REEB67]
MSKPHFQIFIFGKTKLYVHQLIFFNCRLNSSATSFLEVARACKSAGKPFVLEDSNVEELVFVPENTVILKDIFLSECFGLSIEFKQASGSFVSQNSLQQTDLLEITSATGEEVHLLNFIQASPVI